MSEHELRFEPEENGMVMLLPLKAYLLGMPPQTDEIALLLVVPNKHDGYPDLRLQLKLAPDQAMSLGSRLQELAEERAGPL